MLHVSSNILSEEFIAHMGKFYEAGESFWLRDLEKIYLMRLALGPSGVDGPQPATAALLAELQPEYWADDGFLSKYVQADGLESFEGRFGVEVMLGIANDDMDISDLMAPYVKETLAGVAAKRRRRRRSRRRRRRRVRRRRDAGAAASERAGARRRRRRRRAARRSGRPGGRATAAPAAAPTPHRRRRRRR